MVKIFYCSDYPLATAAFSNAGNSSSATERDYLISQGSSIASKNQIFYHTVTMTDSGDKNPSDSGDGKDEEGDETGSLKTEDFEVRMDLTDDLLHMV